MRQPGKESYDQRKTKNNLIFLLNTYNVPDIILKALYVLSHWIFTGIL